MKRPELNDVAVLDGQLLRVIGIASGRHVTFEVLGKPSCETCGRGFRISMLEGTSLWSRLEAPSVLGREP